ncbi:MAG: 2Fe-2S iron-sulfur cluster-binding protein, partial [Syntrophomonadaceae bacterium]
MVSIEVNGISASVPKNFTVMQAAAAVGFEIPSLCSHPDLKVKDNCKVCVVDINGELKTACAEVVAPGMSIKTFSPSI